MTLLHSFPVGQAVELSALGRQMWRQRHPLRHQHPTGTVVGRGRQASTIRVKIDFRSKPETWPARYWQPLLKP